MKGFLQATTLFCTLFLGQQAFTQENKKENSFYIPRFTRERAVQELMYENIREHEQDYLPINNTKPPNELREFIIDKPLLRTFYEISTDRKPIQLFDGKINFSFAKNGNSLSSRKSISRGIKKGLLKLLGK